MKIQVEKWIVNDEVSYHIIGCQKCCDDILNNRSIRLNYEYDENSKDEDFTYSVKLSEVSCIDYQYDDDIAYAYKTINYCPFCGEKINIEVVNTIDKSAEYDILCDQRNDLWNKCNTTDSKTEEQELRKQVRALDIKINNMLSSSTLYQMKLKQTNY